jgi:acyl-CoA synthetase (AMP-forming)/AMP-acid ligase II
MENVYATKPWLKFYDKEVPPTLTYPSMTYAAFIRRSFDYVPDRVALYYMDNSMTYRQLDQLSNQFANFLISRGCRPGDTVGVHLLNVYATYIASIGIQKAGCVYTGISALLTADELQYQLNDSESKVLVTLDFLFGVAAKVVSNTGVMSVLVTSFTDFLPSQTTPANLESFPGIEVLHFPDAIKDMRNDLVRVKVDPGEACLMMYTGGTTGPPKGAILTHNNIVHHIVQLIVWLHQKTGEEITLTAFPMFHQAGNLVAMASMADGTSLVVIPNPRDLQYVITAIKKYKPTLIGNVPTLFIEMMKLPEFRALDFSGVKQFMSGASAFPAENINEFKEIVKNDLLEVCGMTETSPILTALPLKGMKKVGSVGLPISDTEVKLVDPETGKIVGVGEPGEMVARGPQVFTKGYHNKPEETKHTLRDGWIYTGDIEMMDEDGYFYVVDRLKDMVSVSGFKVFTKQVDDVLVEHPDVYMAATIGLNDPNRPGSEIVASAIVLKPGIEKSEAAKQKITAYMKEKVSPYKVPKVIEFMDQLPMSAVGKVLKRELRTMMQRK